MVGVVRGALGPQLEKTIRQQLDYEHQVLEGKAERVAVSAHTIYNIAQNTSSNHCCSDTVYVWG